MSEFPYKTAPFEFQREALRRGAERKYYGLLMEQGTGKSKVIIDNAAFLFLRERIGALIVIAPNGVHLNWDDEEIPKHMSPAVPYRTFVWESGKTKTKYYQEAWADFVDEEEKLVILLMNIEATITKAGNKALRTILDEYHTMMVIDESVDIKTPGAKRTKRLWALGRKAAYRRILTGSFAPEGAMDVYAQLKFLSPHIVGTRFSVFKHEYGIWEQQQLSEDRSFPVLVGYKNIEKLKRIISEHTFRVRRDEVMDLPRQMYTKRPFDLSAEQWRMYRELRDTYLTTYADGSEVSAGLAMVRYLRLHQITCGYVPTDESTEDDPVRRIPGPNPRLEAMLDWLSKMDKDRKAIIWYRFILDGDLLMEALKDYNPVRYDGQVDNEGRTEAKVRFREDPDTRIFIGNPQAAGRGLTLTSASAVLYYSNHFGLELRKQSEDRAHRHGAEGSEWEDPDTGNMVNSVLYVDFMGNNTIDRKIIKGLRDKEDLRSLLTGDPRKDWI